MRVIARPFSTAVRAVSSVRPAPCAGEWPVWETNLHNPSFASFARLCGGKGAKVSDPGDLERMIAEALAHDGPSLVEIMTDAELV